MTPNIFSLRARTLLLTTALTLTLYSCGKPAATAETQASAATNPVAASERVAASDDETAAPAESPHANDTLTTTARPKDGPSQTKQNTTGRRITDGYYAMGGTGQGLEVRGDQYRYYDEGGEHEWQPTSQLTAISPSHVFDGENYWCHSDNVPEGGGICTANGWQAYSSVGQLSADELFLGGVEAGAREAEVIAALGQPDQIDRVSPFSSQFTYRGLSVSFYEDAALNLRSVSPDYCTPSGICPGMDVSEVERIYGAPLVDPRSDGDYWQYANTEVACTMELEVTNETVGAIAIICQI